MIFSAFGGSRETQGFSFRLMIVYSEQKKGPSERRSEGPFCSHGLLHGDRVFEIAVRFQKSVHLFPKENLLLIVQKLRRQGESVLFG